MICPTAHPPGHIPPLKSVDECRRKWSALCLSAYRAIHRKLVPESLGWRDSSVRIERPMETDGEQGRLDKPLSYRLWKHVMYFSACHGLWYKLLLTQKKCHAQSKRDRWFACRLHATLSPYVRLWYLLNITSSVSPWHLGLKWINKTNVCPAFVQLCYFAHGF